MNDPLHLLDDGGRDLFAVVMGLCNGASNNHVRNVAVSLLLNSIRQSVPLRKDAEALLDEAFRHAKGTLLDQYDAVTGKRKTVVPFTQVAQVPFHTNKNKVFS